MLLALQNVMIPPFFSLSSRVVSSPGMVPFCRGKKCTENREGVIRSSFPLFFFFLSPSLSFFLPLSGSTIIAEGSFDCAKTGWHRPGEPPLPFFFLRQVRSFFPPPPNDSPRPLSLLYYLVAVVTSEFRYTNFLLPPSFLFPPFPFLRPFPCFKARTTRRKDVRHQGSGTRCPPFFPPPLSHLFFFFED